MLAYETPLYVETNATGMLYRYYVHGEIGAIDHYADLLDMLTSATPLDTITIYINSNGGHLTTAINIMEAMQQCKATTIANVSGDCQSAATLIMLGARHYVISEYTSFMFHNFSGGVFGKGGEMYDQVVHMKSTYDALFRQVYEPVLSETELDDMLKGIDMWMTGTDVITRLNERSEGTELVDSEDDFDDDDGYDDDINKMMESMAELGKIVGGLATTLSAITDRVNDLSVIVTASMPEKEAAIEKVKVPKTKKK